MSNLKKFEGRTVGAASIKVVNAGDGLSQAMQIEPTEYPEGATVYVLLETECARVAYEGMKDSELLRRVHTLKAGVGTVVSREFATEAIEKQRVAIEEAEGVLRLEADADGDEWED